MSKEAIKRALEAAEVLEKLFKQAEAINKGTISSVNVDCQIAVDDLRKGLNAAPALREALAEQQEPVARQYQGRDGVWRDFINEKHYKNTLEDGSWPIRDLYTSPPAQRRQLTDELLRKMHYEDQFGLFCDYDEFEQIARAIEAAHGIKGDA